VYAEAWRLAFPLLWQSALRLLNIVLDGPEHARDREDIAAKAISELVRSLVEKDLPSFNQIATLDDLLDMTQQIVRYRTRDFFRSRGRRPEDLTDDPPEPPGAGAEASPRWSREEFDAQIALLSPPQPEIFRLHYVEGHTAEAIAIRLDKPRSTILSHLFRGKKAIRKRLEEAGFCDASRAARSPLLPHD
jgi:RNA polymerase sigma factor (sigma-70 family)